MTREALTGVELALQASGTEVISRLAPDVARQVLAGSALSTALESAGVFPHSLVQQLRSGEIAGDVDTILQRAAADMRVDGESAAYVAAYILASIIFLIVALIIAYKILSMAGAFSQGNGAI